jgi:hypothetical protein
MLRKINTALIALLFLFTTVNAEEITTNNLLDKNFDSGSWSGYCRW